jgi:hypothetical protein
LRPGELRRIARALVTRGSIVISPCSAGLPFPRRLCRDDKRRGEGTGQGGQHEATAVHAGMVGRMRAEVNQPTELLRPRLCSVGHGTRSPVGHRPLRGVRGLEPVLEALRRGETAQHVWWEVLETRAVLDPDDELA